MLKLQWKYLGTPDIKYIENIPVDFSRPNAYDKSPNTKHFIYIYKRHAAMKDTEIYAVYM